MRNRKKVKDKRVIRIVSLKSYCKECIRKIESKEFKNGTLGIVREVVQLLAM